MQFDAKETTTTKSLLKIVKFVDGDGIILEDIVSKKEGIYHDFFNVFYPFVKEHFVKNYDKTLIFAQKLFVENPIPQTLKTSLYLMNITLDYEKLLHKLENSKKIIDAL